MLTSPASFFSPPRWQRPSRAPPASCPLHPPCRLPSLFFSLRISGGWEKLLCMIFLCKISSKIWVHIFTPTCSEFGGVLYIFLAYFDCKQMSAPRGKKIGHFILHTLLSLCRNLSHIQLVIILALPNFHPPVGSTGFEGRGRTPYPPLTLWGSKIRLVGNGGVLKFFFKPGAPHLLGEGGPAQQPFSKTAPFLWQPETGPPSLPEVVQKGLAPAPLWCQ